MIPNLRHLRAVREVARYRSITRAASVVYLSQPAITQAIGKLEARTSARLFERRSDGMHPSEAGRRLLARIERALELIDQGCRDALRAGRAGHRAKGLERKLTGTQLKALVAVCEAGSFTLAARRSGASQPSLHRAARDLERLLDLTLFSSDGQGVTPSRAARAFSQQVKLAFAELRQGFDELASTRGTDQGSVVVGTLPLARSQILPTAINALTRLHPDSRIRVVDGPYDDLLAALRHGEIDCLIGALREPPPVEDITQESLFEDPLSVVARHDHPLFQRPALNLRQLAAFPWVVPRPGTPTRTQFERLFAAEAPGPPRRLVEASSLILIRGLLLHSDRLALISTHQVGQEQRLGLLRPLPLRLAATTRRIGLTLRRDWRPTPLQAAFLGQLRRASGQIDVACPADYREIE